MRSVVSCKVVKPWGLSQFCSENCRTSTVSNIYCVGHLLCRSSLCRTSTLSNIYCAACQTSTKSNIYSVEHLLCRLSNVEVVEHLLWRLSNFYCVEHLLRKVVTLCENVCWEWSSIERPMLKLICYEIGCLLRLKFVLRSAKNDEDCLPIINHLFLRFVVLKQSVVFIYQCLQRSEVTISSRC